MVKYVLGLLLLSCSVFAQTTLLDDISLQDLQRNAQLLNGKDSSKYENQSFMIRSTSALQELETNASEKFKVHGVSFRHTIQNNNLMPLGFNQGTMYPSVGFQRRWSLGVHFSWKFLDVNLQPEWVLAENSPTPPFLGNQEDGNYWARYFFIMNNVVDQYSQFGDQTLKTFFPGQSRIAFKFNNISTGISTENNWWGPGFRNSLMMTNEASGFFHYFVQNRKPIVTPLGTIDAKGLIGMLENPTMLSPEDANLRSVWAGGIAVKNNSVRMLKSFIVNWQPKWVPNFYLGYSFAQQNYFTNEGPQPGKLFVENPKMQLGAFLLRFALPKDHAEFYAELGQPDKVVGPASFFGDSTKTGFVLGGRKLFPLGKKKKSYLQLAIEFTQLQLMDPGLVINNNEPFGGPLYNSWYTSTAVRQGYTQNGKMLGASIGPGSNSQTIHLSWHRGRSLIRVHFERLVKNNDFYVFQYYVSGYANRYYVNLATGIEAQISVSKNMMFGASLLQTSINNYKWVRIEDGIAEWSDSSSKSDYTNLQWQVSLKYDINGGR
ncbi:capsule assembly Wzi family protein [Aquirufa antheringensis]|uniref:capsule assembly Wzi family protein n=1 Tax=Aquirufa antheringensis TaxID=2516559 RepID=UPI0022A96B8D|nr:capsule assembly Wzi family protein [Aquirufa antheringensis]MCZ2484708.1 capsule assembly Wzi family protein [Aquirufa antheringensis]